MKTEEKWCIAQKQGGGPEILNYNPKMISEGGEYWSRSRMFSTREELFEEYGLDDALLCKECGGHIQTKSWIGKVGDILKERGLCHSCNHYVEAMDTLNDPRRVIVNGGLYWRKDWDSTSPRHCLGFGGSVYRIKMNTGEEYKTNNLWFNGEIPERFRDRLKDNAIFLK